MHLRSLLGPLHQVLLFLSSPLVCSPSLESAQVHSNPLKSTQIHLARHCCCFLWLILVHGFPRVLLQTRESNYCIFTVAMFSVLFTS